MTDNNTIKMVLNEELNGVELYFPGKPDQKVINTLKENRFRWSNNKKCWYAKQNSNTLTFAQTITIGQEIPTMTPAQTATTAESYFPSYTHVNGKEIFKSSDIELKRVSGYFADIKAYIHFYNDSIVLIDLTNALKTGKECNRYSINLSVHDNSKSILTILWNTAKLETLKQFHNAVITDQLNNIETLTIYKGTQKSINTFSPFVKIKPIITPKKWTIAHVWKAILAGQIFKGVKDGHYTDDYAYDAACNFGTGSRLHTISMAEKLIESPSGWWVCVDKIKDDGTIILGVNCHSFDSNTFYYDEKCNMKEAEQRRQQEAQELEEYNNSLLSEVLPVAFEEVKENTLYNITYLEMDTNSKRYSKKSELLTGSELFWQDEIYIGEDTEPTIEYKIRYKITSIEEYPITDGKLYTVSNFHFRPRFDDDTRFINMGNWETIITGRTLREVLREQGNIFSMVQESKYTFDQAITTIKNHITGKMMWCVGACDTDYQESFKRIMREINRLNVNVIAL